MTNDTQQSHTPGPWTVYEPDTGGGPVYRIAHHDSLVALTPTVGTEYGRALLGANARLIAAAPDLLYAAQKAERALTEFFEDHGSDPDNAPNITRLRDAIAKAEGR